MAKKIFTFLIIFLTVFGFLVFNFRKPEEVEVKASPVDIEGYPCQGGNVSCAAPPGCAASCSASTCALDPDTHHVVVVNDNCVNQTPDSNCTFACFTGDTLITMGDGSYKKIKDVKVGEQVLAFDEEKKVLVKDTVEEVFHHSSQQMEGYYLVINNKIKVTPNHPIYTFTKGWKPAGELKEGYLLMDESGEFFAIHSIQKVYKKIPTYNIHTGEYHNYFASQTLVHNKINMCIPSSCTGPTGTCDYNCQPNYGNCDGDDSNGCEANLLTDRNNCGGCGAAYACDWDEECINGQCIAPPRNLYGWAWSENIGWISFNSANCDPDGDGKYEGAAEGAPDACPSGGQEVTPYGVYLPPFDEDGDPVGSADYSAYFKGYAWSENIGWIKFDPTDSPPIGTNCYLLTPAQSIAKDTVGFIRACAGAANADCTGGSNPAAGGWDGWICMSGTTTGGNSYGVVFNTATNEFEGWAWGGGGTDENSAVVGWISWNHLNCDPNGNGVSDGIGNCPPAGTSIPDYKVTYEPGNTPPDLPSGLTDTWNYCCYQGCLSPKVLQGATVSLSWDYSDPDGTPQGGYEIWVDDDPDFGDSLSLGKFNLQVVRPDLGYGSHSYVLDLTEDEECEAGNCWRNGADLDWNTTYYWKVKVMDTAGDWSGWSDTASFTTLKYPYPYVDFTWCPLYPRAGQTVQFCSQIDGINCNSDPLCPAPSPDDTTCYNASGETPCANWNWTFEEGTPSNSSAKNPTVEFNVSGSWEVTLTVEDSTPAAEGGPYSCTVSDLVDVEFPLPKWREILPF